MSSQEWLGKRRCFVKKLDFEDCVLTNRTKLNTSKQKRTRAKSSRELLVKKGNSITLAGDTSPVLCSRNISSSHFVKTIGSPVLIKRPPILSCSPVLLNESRRFQKELVKRKLENSIDSILLNESRKCQNQLSKRNLHNSSDQVQEAIEGTCSQVIEMSSSPVFDCSPDLFQSKDRIQTTSQESEYKIDSGPSDEVETSSADILVSSTPSSEQQSVHTPIKQDCKVEPNMLDSGKKRKRLKKGSLSARLEVLLKRQMSDRRILNHEMETLKNQCHQSEKLKVCDVWTAGSRLLVQCDKGICEPTDKLVLLLDKTCVRNMCDLRKGSAVVITPPWQKLRLRNRDPPLDVLMSIGAVQVKADLDIQHQDMVDSTADSCQVKPIAEEEFAENELFLGQCLF